MMSLLAHSFLNLVLAIWLSSCVFGAVVLLIPTGYRALMRRLELDGHDLE